MFWKKRVLIVVETSRSFGRNVIQGVARYVSEKRNWTLYFQDRGLLEDLPVCIDDWKCDGIITRSNSLEAYERLRAKGVPIVELLGDEVQLRSEVRNDERINCQMVADHFWERGFRNFAFFAMRRNFWAQERYDNFRRALERYGASCDAFLVLKRFEKYIERDHDWGWWKDSEEEVFQWVNGLPKPLAVFCAWDMPAFFLINVCNSNGIIVPSEISVLGYGNNADLCNSSYPPLTSVGANGREIGYQAAVLLDKKMNGHPLPSLPIEVPASHIALRLSTDFIAVKNPIVAKAIGYIRNNIAGRPSVSDIAQNLGVSKSTLSRLFRKWTDHSPEDEIIRCSMQWAEELLRDTSYTVAFIAGLLRYSTPSSFIRVFKRINGCTPEEYRDNQRHKDH